MTDSTLRDERSDRELVAAFQQGDEQSFVTIVERYKTRLMRLAQSVVHNEDDALDVLQEAFVKIFRNLGMFRQSSTLYTWLYRIVLNHAIDHVRSRPQLRLDCTEELAQNIPDKNSEARPDRSLLAAELRDKIFAAVDRLPRKQREVILLREVEGLSYREIADTMGCSEGTVMSRLFYGRERLREALEPYLRNGI